MKPIHHLIAGILILFVASSALASEPPRVYVSDLDVSKLEIESPRDHRFPYRGEFELSDKELAGLQELYVSSVSTALQRKSQFVLVESAAEADFVVSSELLKLMPAAPKDDLRHRDVNERLVSYGAGQALLRVEIVRDEIVVAEIEDVRDAGRDWGINDRFHNKQHVKRMFSSWGSKIAKQLSGA